MTIKFNSKLRNAMKNVQKLFFSFFCFEVVSFVKENDYIQLINSCNRDSDQKLE